MTNSQSTPKPAIIFDFGGVLFDWNPHYLYHDDFNGDTEAIDRFLQEIGFSEWNLHQDRGRPFAEAVAELSARFPHYASLIRAYDERYESSLSGPIHATVVILERLKQAGYPLYALSNWSVEKFALIRPKYAFLDWFDAIVLSGALKLVKPDPRIFEVFLEQIGRKPEECLFIDDSRKNIEAANRMGFQTIRFESPEQLERELRERGIGV